MPTYEYRCNQCGKHFEVFKSINDESIPECPYCGSTNVTRLISATNFILKGSGWYVTDYARKSGNSTSSTGKQSSQSKDSGTSDKSETL